jgi:hypothetical protein
MLNDIEECHVIQNSLSHHCCQELHESISRYIELLWHLLCRIVVTLSVMMCIIDWRQTHKCDCHIQHPSGYRVKIQRGNVNWTMGSKCSYV